MGISDDIELQREYYARTAAEYDSCHVGPAEPEHDFALCLLGGVIQENTYRSFLDVGAGTGRGMAWISSHYPDAVVQGVEPVAELREIAYRKGIPPNQLTEGDANQLAFPDDSFDCVLALGIMHHLPDPRRALAEMVRVSRKAVFISDLNNFGCGGKAQKGFAHVLRALGLWRGFQYLKNGFKHAKYSEGDGIHYSYSILDDVPFLASLGCRTYIFGITPCRHASLLWGGSHAGVLAIKQVGGLKAP